MIGPMSLRTPFALCLAALLTSPAAADILQNDSAAPGGEIAFYPRLQAEESFRVILDGPEWPTYRICRLFVWIGPDDFNTFIVRIGEADAAGGEAALIWQTGEEVYQINGSQVALGALDLRRFDITTDARQLRVRFTHAPGFPAPPTIASDTDGITPGRNQIRFTLRNGDEFDDYTENLPVEGTNPRPPGDWIVRAEVVQVDEVCPAEDGPIPTLDAGVDDPDQGLPADAGPPPDARVRDARPVEEDARPAPDARVRDARPAEEDARPDDPRDAGSPDARLTDTGPTGGSDAQLGAFALERISPIAGPPERNIDVVVNGRGFPFGQPITAYLGQTRLLEAQVLSESTLTAIVPAGMEPGTYALQVERSDGQIAILPEAYQVVGPSAGTPAEDDCGCDLAGRGSPSALGFLLLAGLCLRRRR